MDSDSAANSTGRVEAPTRNGVRAQCHEQSHDISWRSVADIWYKYIFHHLGSIWFNVSVGSGLNVSEKIGYWLYNWSALFNPASWSWCRKVLAWQHAPDVFAVHILQQSQLKTHWFAGAFHQEGTSIASQAERIGTLDDFGLKAAWQMTVTLRMIPKVANT